MTSDLSLFCQMIQTPSQSDKNLRHNNLTNIRKTSGSFGKATHPSQALKEKRVSLTLDCIKKIKTKMESGKTKNSELVFLNIKSEL